MASVTAHQHADAMADYLADGERRALALGNRGAIHFKDDGTLADDILEAYWRCGFYVFKHVVGRDELNDIETELAAVLARAPHTYKAKTDAMGNPAIGSDLAIPPFSLVKPLADPVGGTAKNAGRHQIAMIAPEAPEDAPEYVVQVVFGTLHVMDSCLRLYGHPQLLQVAEAINGPDFTPFNEAIFIKQPGLGASVAWHQDATTHWSSAELDGGTHGFNFMCQVYGCTAANAVWVVPGTHLKGKLNLKELVVDGTGDRIADAVPMICEPGDVVMCNRQVVHGSFANTSPDLRVSVGFGFHRRRSVLNADAQLLNGQVVHYDEARIRERSRIIALAIDARAQRYPQEDRYVYQPLAGYEAENQWSEETRESILKNYNLRDLHI